MRYGYAESKGLDLPELCARATKHNLDAEVICNSIPSSINLGMMCFMMLSTQSSALLLLHYALLYSLLFFSLLYSTLPYSTPLDSDLLHFILLYSSLLLYSFVINSIAVCGIFIVRYCTIFQ